MEQKISGKLIRICPVETGISANGYNWARQTIVVSPDGNTNIAISVFGTECYDVEKFKEGDIVDITYTINASERNGRWFNNVGYVSMNRSGEFVEERGSDKISFEDWLNG